MFEKKEFFKCAENNLIKINGIDKFNFIQGIISNDINILKKKTSIFSSMLTPQGKFLYDFFITNFNDQLYLECNSKNTSEILQKLNLYKLRSNVEFQVDKDLTIILTNENNSLKIKKISKNKSLDFFDPRFTNFFKRIYLKNKNFSEINENEDFQEINKKKYNEIRIENCIPDFMLDSFKNKSLLMEMRFDELNGISWEKGCFMGQEITARMKYRNIIKKKLISISIDFNSKLGAEIICNQKIIGSLLSHTNRYGIGYINTDFLIKENKDKIICGDSVIKVSSPWWCKKK
tara:strand:+ start:892 stop:1761 length:870 start_codon:yes stop_codon:yes gene_type:complete